MRDRSRTSRHESRAIAPTMADQIPRPCQSPETEHGWRSLRAPSGHVCAVSSFILIIASAAFGADQSAKPSSDEVVTLPPLMVEERQAPLPWHYVSVPGLEVLSVCDDDVTRAFVWRVLRLDAVLRVILPERFQFRTSVPRIQILFNEDLSRARSQEIMKEMLGREGGQEPLRGRINLFAPGRAGDMRQPGLPRRVFFLPNLRLNDVDAEAVFAATQGDNPDGLEFTFVVDRIAYLLERRVPALPDWFVEGMVGFYRQCLLRGDRIDVDPATWTSETETRALATEEYQPRTLLPIGELLTMRKPTPGIDNSERAQVWRAQCALFVRWAVVGNAGAHRPGLWKLVDHLENEPWSETLFRECLGLGSADVRDQLSDYLPDAVRERTSLAVPKPGERLEVKPRPATDVEIARLRGDWERMEILYVSKRWPELTEKYVDQARRTLQKAYAGGARDPALLAVIGLTECDAGNRTGARAYLEAAAQAGIVRPRVYAELARMRYDEAIAAIGDGKLNAQQVARILEPLRALHDMEPTLVEACALMAEVWSRTDEKPTANDLDQLTRGAGQYPRFAPLLMRTIYLDASNGRVKAAADLASVGQLAAPDARTQARFKRVAQQLMAAQREK